jgi:glycosyltransferase involved in cell wall biosynthesis
MWPETLSATGMVRNKEVLKWVGRFADWVYGRMDRILVISPGFRRNLLEKGVPDEKIRVISNWVNTDVYYPMNPGDCLHRVLALQGKFNVMYAGNIGAAQGLDTVLEAAQALNDLSNVQFVLIGDGVAADSLRHMAESRSLDNVRFLGRFPESEMSSLFAQADVLLIHLKDDPLFRITIPHKVFSYMAAGKPILAAVEGDAADIVLQARAGLTCPPENALALADALRHMHSIDANERIQMGLNGLSAARNRFTPEILVAEIERVLSEIVVEHGTIKTRGGSEE